MLKFLKLLKPCWLEILALFLATGIQVWCSLQIPTLMAQILNQGIMQRNLNFIWITSLWMILNALIATLGALLVSFFSAKISTIFAHQLRHQIFQKIINFSISEIDRFSTASLLTRSFSNVNQLRHALSLCLSTILRAPLMCIGAIIQAITTAANMTWIIVLAVIVLLSTTATILTLVLPKIRIFQKLFDQITLLTRENLTGLRVIRAFNNQNLAKQKFAKTNDKLTRVDVFIAKVVSFRNPIISFIFNGTTLLCVWIGVNHLSENLSYLGNMMAFAQYAGQVVMSFLMLTMILITIPRANVAAQRISEVLDAHSLIKWPAVTVNTPSQVASIEFKNVSFAYPGAEEEILHDISFSVQAGETIAFIGSTGSGKSTLIKLIPRFFEITKGKIILNGLDIHDYSELDLTSQIGYIPQTSRLFSGTIESNLKFGAPHATDAEMKTAAKIAQAAGFINRLDKKYHARVSQGGSNLSGGQRQRLSIARAITKRPKIYLFDDAFSALDAKTDAKLRAALKTITQNAVTLIVAQRIDTIKDADQIIVLDNGRIVGRGQHYALLNNCQIYQEIAQSQFSEVEFTTELKKARSHHA